MPAITYNQSIPQATDQISQSQPLILQNFGAINTWAAIDHATFASINAGYHNKVTFPVQASATFPANTPGLFSKAYSVSSKNEIYVNLDGGTQVPFTAAKGASNPGYTYLPSGLLIKWGSASPNGETIVNFPVAADIPVFTAVYNAQVTTIKGSTAANTFIAVKSFTTTSITFIATQQTTLTTAAGSCYYMVIGK